MARVKTPLALLVTGLATLSRSPVLVLATQHAAEALVVPADAAGLPRRQEAEGESPLDRPLKGSQPARLRSFLDRLSILLAIPMVAGSALIVARLIHVCELAFEDPSSEEARDFLILAAFGALVCGAISQALPPTEAAATLAKPVSHECPRASGGGVAARDAPEPPPSESPKAARDRLLYDSMQGKPVGLVLREFFAHQAGVMFLLICLGFLDGSPAQQRIIAFSVGAVVGGLLVPEVPPDGEMPPEDASATGARPGLHSCAAGLSARGPDGELVASEEQQPPSLGAPFGMQSSGAPSLPTSHCLRSTDGALAAHDLVEQLSSESSQATSATNIVGVADVPRGGARTFVIRQRSSSQAQPLGVIFRRFLHGVIRPIAELPGQPLPPTLFDVLRLSILLTALAALRLLLGDTFLVAFALGVLAGGLPVATGGPPPPRSLPRPPPPPAGASPGSRSRAAAASRGRSDGEDAAYEQSEERRTWRYTGRAARVPVTAAVETVPRGGGGGEEGRVAGAALVAPAPSRDQAIGPVPWFRRLPWMLVQRLILISAGLCYGFIRKMVGGASGAAPGDFLDAAATGDAALVAAAAAASGPGCRPLAGSPEAAAAAAAAAPSSPCPTAGLLTVTSVSTLPP